MQKTLKCKYKEIDMSSVQKIGVISAIAASLFMTSLTANAASDSVPVNITASVVNNTCTPDWAVSGVNVDLSRVAVKDFGSDKVGSTNTFTLNLKDCGSDATKVTVSASGAADGTDASLFSNTVSSTSGVGVGIWGGPSQTTQMKPNGDGNVEYPISNNAANMTFMVKLMQTGDSTPVAGQVKSTVTMTIAYQ